MKGTKNVVVAGSNVTVSVENCVVVLARDDYGVQHTMTVGLAELYAALDAAR